MKNFFNYFSALSVAAIALVSCNKSEIDVPSQEGYTYSFNIVDDLTKATLDNGGVLWEANDKVGMYLEGYTGYAEVDMETSPKSVKLYSTNAIPAGSYAYAYYPYAADNNDKTMTKVVLNPIQQGGSNAAMPMVGLPFKVEEEAEAKSRPNGNIRFMNLGSIIDFKIYSDKYTEETVQYVTFQAVGATIAGDACLDLTAVNASDETSLELVWGLGENEYDYVKVKQEVPVAVTKAEATSVYMVVAPGTYSGTITIGTDAATYTFTYTNKELARNVVKHYNMNLNNATRVNEVLEVVKPLPYEEAFTTGKGEFEIEGGTGNEWTFGQYGATVTGYYQAEGETQKTNHAANTSLISPWIDLTDVADAQITFEHNRNGFLEDDDIAMSIQKYGEETWNELTLSIPSKPSKQSSFSGWKDATVSLSEYVGGKVKVKFSYTSTKDNAGTYEFKNFHAEKVKLDAGLAYGDGSIVVEATVADETIEAPALTNPNNLDVTYSSSNEDVAVVFEDGAIMLGGIVGNATITASFAGDDNYNEGSASYIISVSDPNVTVNDFTWDLTKASYSSASNDQVKWENANVTMVADKAGATTDANNYLPTKNNSSRFYKNSTLTFTPASGVTVVKVEYTATTTSYATALSNSPWKNASASVDESIVTIIPIDGTKAFSATIGATTGASRVKVYYTGGSVVVDTEYTVTVSETTNGTVTANPAKATKGTEITLTITPDTDYELDELKVVDAENNTVTVENNKFTMPEANVTVSATFKGKETTGGGTEATINFGNNGTKINGLSVTGTDSQKNTWTITTAFSDNNTSFTQNANYSQVGAAKKPATSITFTTTLPNNVAKVNSLSIKMGGFSGTAGTVTLKVGETTVGTGSLDGTSDVTVSSTEAADGRTITITVTDIEKGVKVYSITTEYE